MKKLFFSAVALVAFSSVSMANTIEIEETEVKNIIVVDPCFKTAIRMMDLIEANNGEITDIVFYNNVYQYYVWMCHNGYIKL
ncbi:hypothetical protein [Flavobacterium sp.]|uniref:hypothetical protein n=1 Tax=Flavobacterium sp. TaxID=239 RepID=UPI0022C82B15|nr:hypothetical protein [Flavobacterium sp.]MCZ8089407.1 hypothetical protein [Flavobacterium sp.]